MRKHLHRYITIFIAVLMLMTGSAIFVSAEGDGSVSFSNISDGMVISELTVLQGTIDFDDFLKYEIYLKAGDNMIWMANSHSAITDGNLARLDPRVFADGTYTVVVRKVYNDSNYTEVEGPVITIDNPNDAPAPYYPEVEPSFLYPSKQFAILRVRNCTGEDFNFDYTSPQSGRSAGDEVLPPRPTDDTICTFHDLPLIPGEYRGTGQGGGQEAGAPFTIEVDEWKVYHLLYNGPGAGADMIIAREVNADPKQGDGASDEHTYDEVKTPTPVSETTAMLPVTGDNDASTRLPVVLVILLIVALAAGGVVAASRRQVNR